MSADAGSGASERLAKALDRIAAHNDELRIVTALAGESAREFAAASDERDAAGASLGPLDGLVIGVKDNIAVANMPWTAGIGAWRTRTAPGDSAVVARLRSAGAIALAMVNMHEGALGATTDNPHYGRTENPLQPGLTPGGSSGGSAAAVAAGFADAALGSDSMGSVRIPAAYCGILGLKPTRGLVSRSGLTHLSPSLDAVGPLAGSFATLASLISAMAGTDGRDPHSLPVPPGWNPAPNGSVATGIRVGIPKQIDEVDCEPGVLKGLEATRAACEALGCLVSDVNLDGWSPGRDRRGGFLVCEAEAAVELAGAIAVPGPDAVSEDLRAMLEYGMTISSDRLVDGYARIQGAAAAACRALAECDVLLVPTTPQRAFPHGGRVPASQADFTSLASFHGGPALALPVPVSGLPASIQLMGRHFSEPLILGLGARLEAALTA